VQNLKQRYRYSAILLKQLVKTDFKLRYQGSFLGYIWSLLRPLAIFVILYIVFTKFLSIGKGVPNYPIYLLLGIVLWNFFIEVTTGSVSIIVSSGEMIRKINFPKYVIILANSFSALINLLLNLIIVAAFMFINNVDLRATAILFPLLILELFVFSLALAFFLSAAFVRFRDVSYIWEVLMQGAFYATPIIYPLALIPVVAAKIIMLNPVAQIIQDARYVLVTDQAQTINQIWGTQSIRLVPYSIVLVSVLVATLYFRARSKYFAEEV
jgi:ABC-2 type transport system permease protein